LVKTTLSNSQFGFRKSKSPKDAIALVMNIVIEDLNNKMISNYVCLHLSKCSDYIILDYILHYIEDTGSIYKS